MNRYGNYFEYGDRLVAKCTECSTRSTLVVVTAGEEEQHDLEAHAS